MGDDGGGGGGGECMLNIFTSSNSKKNKEENKKRKAGPLSQSTERSKNDDPSSRDPPLKKFKAGKNKDFQNKETKSKGNPIKDKSGEDDEKKRVKKSREKRKGNDKSKTERGGAGHVLTKDRPFISNLFTNNPEAPSVEIVEGESTEKKSKEEVFSSSDVQANPFRFHTRINSILKGQFGIEHFTRVQLAAIPVIAQGRDTLVKSQTGSGKTLAYALPIIHSLMSRDPKVDRMDGPYAILIVPTRELVLQGYETFNKLCAGCTWIVPGQLMGGEKKKSEKARLRKGINILIATPGRLLDHLNTTEIFQKQLPSLDFLVFDEADRLMDLGFEKDLNEIIAKIVELRGSKKNTLQSILASATLNDDVSRLVRLSLYDPVTVDTAKMASEDGKSVGGGKGVSMMTTPSTLRHHYLVCPHKLRLVALASFVLEKCRYSSSSSSSSSPSKVIVFVSTLKCVDFFLRLFDAVLNSTELTDVDHDAARATGVKWDPVSNAKFEKDASRLPIAFFGLHGEMPQDQRTKTFREFKSCGASAAEGETDRPTPRRSSVLFCTDVGARGLDVADVSWIVQFHPPGPPEDYVHRVGRCARAGSSGNALLFLTPTETGYVHRLREKADIPALEEVPLLRVLSKGLLPGAKRYLAGGGKKDAAEKPIKMEDAATCLQLKMENVVAVSADEKEEEEGTKSDDVAVEKSDESATPPPPPPPPPSFVTLSKAAYFSFIRSYATYPKDLKLLGFNVKTLHLGHVAKSFALREPPSKIKDIDGNVKQKKKRKEKEGKPKNRKQLKQMSEFSSGL